MHVLYNGPAGHIEDEMNTEQITDTNESLHTFNFE